MATAFALARNRGAPSMRALTAIVVIALAIVSAAPAVAQIEPYPNKPVRIMMPFPPADRATCLRG